MKPIIIIPTYNESCNIKKIVKLIFDEVFRQNDISILVVDSASFDGTAECVKMLQNEYPNLFILEQDKKMGLASAYIDGFKWCLENDFDIFIQMDADMQHNPEIIPDCLEKIQNYDLIIASRYVKNGRCDKDRNILKKIISRAGNFYSGIVLKCPIKDLTGGYNIWTKKALKCIDFDKIISRGYLFQIEIKYNAYKNNMRIYEYPFCFNKRIYGKSKMNYEIITEALTKIWTIKNTLQK